MTPKRVPPKKTLVPDFERDIKEWYILERAPEVLALLLKDQTTKQNIIWATDDYASRGSGFGLKDQILPELIAKETDKVIIPRVCKCTKDQEQRAESKGEVFTPAWICNAQNNLVDNAWFGQRGACFNVEAEGGWETIHRKIRYPAGKTWKDYVNDLRLEITCGEAPYLTSRYDMSPRGRVMIPVEDRIGMLDRKLRVISENVGNDPVLWVKWAENALKSCYGFDWQGDNVFLARENVLWAVLEEFFIDFDGLTLTVDQAARFAEIVSWNIFQMDGQKCVVPLSCKPVPLIAGERIKQGDLFAVEESPEETENELPLEKDCPGCEMGDNDRHTGDYVMVMDWEAGHPVRFASIVQDTLRGA